MESVINFRKKALVLLDTGFDAYLTIAVVKQLRTLGINVLIISLTTGLARDVNGINLYIDKSLSEFTMNREDRLLIIPGGKAYLLSLLTDPRVYQLFEMLHENEGFVLVPDELKMLIAEMEGKRPFSQAHFLFFRNSAPDVLTPAITQLITNHRL